MKRTTRQSNVAPVGAYDDDVGVGEFAPKFLNASWVQLEGNDARASLDEWSDECAGTGTDIENEVAGTYSGVVNESFGPSTIESMPSPSCPLLGHG